MEKKGIVTMCIGKNFESISKITFPIFRTYAQRISADFYHIENKKYTLEYPNIPIFYEVYQLYDLLDIYDRIIYLDIDAIINFKCPDLFQIIPREFVGAYIVDGFTSRHDKDMLDIQKEYGDLNWTSGYFNAGVMIISKQHKEIYNLENGIFIGTYSNQTQLNYNVKKFNYKTFDIGYRNNHTIASNNSAMRFRSNIIHYAGRGHINNKNTIEQIRSDWDILSKLHEKKDRKTIIKIKIAESIFTLKQKFKNLYV